MPQPFNNAVMTDAGAGLLTRAQAGEIKIEFTRLTVGNGVYAENEKTLAFLQRQTALKSAKNSFALSDIEIFSEHSVKITTLITNQSPVTGETLINEGYYINEMGLFAKEKDGADDTEVLYSIVVTSGEKGDFMPPYNGYNPAQITQDYYVTVDNSADITINVTGASPTVAQMQEALAKKADLDENGKIPAGQIPQFARTAILPAGETSITFSLDGILEDDIVRFYAVDTQLNHEGLDIDKEGNQVTVFFEAQEKDVEIRMVVSGGI